MAIILTYPLTPTLLIWYKEFLDIVVVTSRSYDQVQPWLNKLVLSYWHILALSGIHIGLTIVLMVITFFNDHVWHFVFMFVYFFVLAISVCGTSWFLSYLLWQQYKKLRATEDKALEEGKDAVSSQGSEAQSPHNHGSMSAELQSSADMSTSDPTSQARGEPSQTMKPIAEDSESRPDASLSSVYQKIMAPTPSQGQQKEVIRKKLKSDLSPAWESAEQKLIENSRRDSTSSIRSLKEKLTNLANQVKPPTSGSNAAKLDRYFKTLTITVATALLSGGFVIALLVVMWRISNPDLTLQGELRPDPDVYVANFDVVGIFLCYIVLAFFGLYGVWLSATPSQGDRDSKPGKFRGSKQNFAIGGFEGNGLIRACVGRVLTWFLER
eukprot:TRINITY_DN10885_c0_g1_i1.p1 TRINITY_DN10885_c0_g1~~TRINITY_DN10885_c0_g1_i1.p1  ORF type:complete len:428 (+),score=74.59 TRINITY_DN10885_c0_g1_i1:139-1284(+)